MSAQSLSPFGHQFLWVSFVVLLFGSATLEVAVPAPAPFDKAAEDLKQLAGTWLLVKYVQNGVLHDPPTHSIVVNDRNWVFNHNGRFDPSSPIWAIKLNARRKPNTIDLVRSDGKEKFDIIGVYHLERDKLTICYRLSDGPMDKPARPKTVSGRESDQTWHLVFRRKTLSCTILELGEE